MKSNGPIHTDDNWMTRRMKEVVDRVPGCRAEIRPDGDLPHPACDQWLFAEDDAADAFGEFPFSKRSDRAHRAGSRSWCALRFRIRATGQGRA
jgi:hypothetical protein